MGQEQKVVRIKPVFWITALCLVVLFVAVFTKGFGLLKPEVATTNEAAVINNKEYISIPVSEITAEAKWYDYEFEGQNIKFFAVRASDGSIKTAFDACDVCFAEKKGYRQEGNEMVCNNCGNRYPISSLGTENKEGWGCWPGYLSNIIEGDNILIKKSDLQSNQWRASAKGLEDGECDPETGTCSVTI